MTILNLQNELKETRKKYELEKLNFVQILQAKELYIKEQKGLADKLQERCDRYERENNEYRHHMQPSKVDASIETDEIVPENLPNVVNIEEITSECTQLTLTNQKLRKKLKRLKEKVKVESVSVSKKFQESEVNFKNRIKLLENEIEELKANSRKNSEPVVIKLTQKLKSE